MVQCSVIIIVHNAGSQCNALTPAPWGEAKRISIVKEPTATNQMKKFGFIDPLVLLFFANTFLYQQHVYRDIREAIDGRLI